VEKGNADLHKVDMVNGKRKIWMHELAHDDHQTSLPYFKTFNFSVQEKNPTFSEATRTSKNHPDLKSPPI
jgi:hypothetical protein